MPPTYWTNFHSQPNSFSTNTLPQFSQSNQQETNIVADEVDEEEEVERDEYDHEDDDHEDNKEPYSEYDEVEEEGEWEDEEELQENDEENEEEEEMNDVEEIKLEEIQQKWAEEGDILIECEVTGIKSFCEKNKNFIQKSNFVRCFPFISLQKNTATN